MQQLKVAGLTALSHLSKLLVNLFIIKQIAVTQGPEGLGLLGNFMTLVVIAGTLAGGGISSGIIKYISEFTGSLDRQRSFAGSAFVYTAAFSLFVLLIGLLCIRPFSKYIFLSSSYFPYLIAFLVAQIFVAFNNFAYGLMNGHRRNSLYALVTIVGNLIAWFVASYSIDHFGQWGAIIAIVAPAVCPFLPAAMVAVSQPSLHRLKFHSTRKDSVLLSRFSLMLLFSTICFPLVEMHVRNALIFNVSIDAAGYWQAITKLSSAYLSFYSLFLSFYFVPIISAETDRGKLVKETKKMLLFVAALFIVMFTVFLSLKSFVIELVLSDKFIAISQLFVLQMIGDFFRVLGWVIGFIVVAKALTKLFILGEILQGGLFVLLSSFELQRTGELQAVIIAYVETCVSYCIIALAAFYYIFLRKKFRLAQSS
ncbi:O-antigen translocase [Legionella jordanis]|uniref:Lipopolysaccharide biosynthesis protein n=1 Tax=Legionella jordanis TaxID=456 RepID=A0A0W0VFQ7_9GAMM|nr:O-antigen translocase [Legionella jordanis]KTD18952.1 lipopolysaccharide biosynthesis protein [Legionella jordanis]RMX05485.1 O-antigen translocase [Legionella jordanis]VEH13052.1 lipopolysaccharide biosynthesis protein [Legionella jordanis]